MRIGAFPTPVAMQPEPLHILQLQQMLTSDDDDDDDEKKESKEDKKWTDGKWHIKTDNAKRSVIKVRGYSEREYDLEWDLKTLAAKLRRQRSGIQHISMPIKSGNIINLGKLENDRQVQKHLDNKCVVECLCSKRMIKMNANPYNANNSDMNAICNICDNQILSGTEFYHCLSGRGMAHLSGYDLCLSCGAAREQTQQMTAPTCSCGIKMVAIMSFNAYSNSMGVSCNVCNASVDGAIWHCPKQRNEVHPSGFDLCLNCGKTYVGKKSGIMGWLSFNKQ